MQPSAALKRAGLTKVSDNLQPDDQLVVKGSLVFAFFGDEIMRALNERAARQSGNGSKGGL